MTKDKKSKAAIGAAATIGSAAIAAALLYAGKRFKQKSADAEKSGTVPSGEPPETD
ncbi:isopropylmalate isomerase [Erythrobacter ani]|uniref:Isopropylmalate isomerase n=1 Tax=Erythrobacter ani TaxID=2827235 RepID=A0ABS6SPX6_9SPHN|nr:isopropylmalate isomerase [Erythrobacter ani]MBV7266453.1 isopropylmalate isomerase [Erythrobacter ani]